MTAAAPAIISAFLIGRKKGIKGRCPFQTLEKLSKI
jgi:hypothetical protein